MRTFFSACFAVLLLCPAAHAQGGVTNTPLNKCVIPAARDGAAYERFLLLNQRVLDCKGKADLLFVGDSITQGWEGNGKEVWARYYAHRRALNLGISSDHTQHVLWRLQHGNLQGLNPKVVVLLIGVNNVPDETNSPGQVLEGIKAVVATLREKLPASKILLLGIFPFREEFNPQRAKALQINQALKKLDNGKDLFFLDFGHVFIDSDGKIPKELMRDFLHPSAAGYRLWAEAMEPKLAELLGEKPVLPQ